MSCVTVTVAAAAAAAADTDTDADIASADTSNGGNNNNNMEEGLLTWCSSCCGVWNAFVRGCALVLAFLGVK